MEHTTFALLLLTLTLATLATTAVAVLWAAITVLCEPSTAPIATHSTAPIAIGRKSRPTMYRLPMAVRTTTVRCVTRIVTRIVTRDRLSTVTGYGHLPSSLVERYRTTKGWLDCVALDAALELPASRPTPQWRSIGDPLGDMLAT